MKTKNAVYRRLKTGFQSLQSGDIILKFHKNGLQPRLEYIVSISPIKKSLCFLRTKVRSLRGLLDVQSCIHLRTKVRSFLQSNFGIKSLSRKSEWNILLSTYSRNGNYLSRRAQKVSVVGSPNYEDFDSVLREALL